MRRAALALLAASACSSQYGPLMDPGEDCLGCHDGHTARRWTVAGTWARGSTVVLQDAAGRTLTLRGNKVGNFYTAESLAFPLTVSVDGRRMPAAVTSGSCNRCHGEGGGGGDLATGPLMAPGQDCLPCHEGTQAVRWTAAGTWGTGGDTVTLTDAGGKVVRLVTNAAGNFYTADALAFPLQVQVGTLHMPAAATYGGCNRCHAGGGSTSSQNGPLMAPGQDCLSCHDGTHAVRWTAAGTWGRAAGRTVTLRDARGKTVTLVTNAVGNFYTSEPLAFPLAASSGGERMPDPVTYGGCNRCHSGAGD